MAAPANKAESTASPSDSQKNDSNPALKTLEDILNVHNSNLAIFYLVLICLSFLIVLILFIKCCCIFTEQRRSAKKKGKRSKMRGLFMDEIPGYEMKGNFADLGEVEYQLEYCMDRQELTVGIVLCKDLREPGATNPIDCYVKLYIEWADPNSTSVNPTYIKSKIYQTPVKYGTNNPTFGETYTFKIAAIKLPTTTLRMEFYDYSEFGHDVKFGIANVSIHSMDMLSILDKVYEGREFLEACVSEYTGIGELCLILMHDPKLDRLQVTVLEAAKLTLPGDVDAELPEVYVDVKTHLGKKLMEHKKTQTRHKTREPYFSETLYLTIKATKLPLANLTCKVKYKGAMNISKTLGYVELGLDVTENGPRTHWNDMLAKPKSAIAMWHSLEYSKKKSKK